MNEHERSIALAAASIDFPLSTQESATLERHLVACPSCALTVRRLRDDATGLAATQRVPAPPDVREALVRAVAGERAAPSRPTGMRWSLAAALLALVAVGGTFVAGAVIDRLRQPGPAPTDPALVVRPTQAPQPTAAAIPDGIAWHDLGIIGSEFDGRTVQLVLPAPDGGLVAIGRDQASTLPMVWTSDDGVDWTVTQQPDDVFGGRVPTGGVLHDGALWAVGWQIAAQGPQRAVWTSPDGVTWHVAGGSGGLLGTEASDLDIAAGAAGILVWAPDGRAWTSSDGSAWVRSDAGAEGVTDAAVDDAYRLVGLDGGRAFLVTSDDGRSWSTPTRLAAATATRVGAERAGDAVLAWVGDRPYRLTATGWRAVADGPDVPTGDVVGGRDAFASVGSPTTAGVQHAWVGDGQKAWAEHASEPAAKGARTLVAVAPLEDGWYVLTRQGSTYRGWLLGR